MEPLSRGEFERLIAGAEVLERQGGGLSALRTPDNRIVKIWQRRRGLSSDRIWPYSRRFAENCRRLARRGIAAPHIEQAFRRADTGEHILVYPMLAGISLRTLADQQALPLAELAEFYAELHRKGILFRSIHLGNVLQLEHGGFGLIDVTDVRFFRRQLNLDERALNLGYAWAYRGDRQYFTPDVTARLLVRYFKRARLGKREAQELTQRMVRYRRHYERRSKSSKTGA